MVHDASKVLHARVGIHFPFHSLEEQLRNGLVTPTDSVVFNAHILVSSVLVVAKKSQAFGHHNNGVSLYDVPLGSIVGHLIKVLGIIFVGDSGRSIVDNFNLIEDFGVFDIDV